MTGLMQQTYNPRSSQLALLLADESLIETRKLNVRRFGANWLRPPGVAKTYQARLDEEMERREQAEMARREAVMAELTAAEEAQRGPQPQMVVAEDEDAEAGDVDLDADVPDADGSEGDDEDSDDDDDDEEEDETNVASRFNEESLLEGSLVGGDGLPPGLTQGFLDAEDAELDGRAQDLRDLGGGPEVDLDDDIPEAGSYEHTDTDEEDDDDDEDDEDDDDDEDAMDTGFASVRPGGNHGRRSLNQGAVGLRSSIGQADLSLVGLESSELGILDSDSPVLARLAPGTAGSRPAPQGNAWRERMIRARRGRN